MTYSVPGALAARRGVEQHRRVLAVAQRVREVHAADAEVDDLDAGRQLAPREPRARARRRSRRRRGRRCRSRPRGRAPRGRGRPSASGSTSSGEKKKRWPGWRRSPRSRPGSSSTVTASWHVAVDVLLDRLDDAVPAVERAVEDVAALRAGAAARGCRRRTSTPSTVDASGAGRSSSSQPLIAAIARELADRAVQAHELVLASAPRCARGSRARAGRWRASRPSPRRSARGC